MLAKVERKFYQKIGRHIREMRLQRGLSQDRLGELIGLTRTSITNIEYGRQRMLLHTIEDLSTALECPKATLFDGSDYPDL